MKAGRFGALAVLATTTAIAVAAQGLVRLPASASTSASQPARVGAAAVASTPAVTGAEAAARAGQRLARAGATTVRTDTRTGRTRFVAAAPGRAIDVPQVAAGSAAVQGLGVAAKARPGELPARAFVRAYGDAFGVADPATQLSTSRALPGADGSVAVRFQQRHRGVPVLGGELVVTVTAGGDTTSANGELSPDLDAVGTTPRRSAAEAGRKALAEAAAAHPAAEGLSAGTPALWILDPALLGLSGPGERALVWRVPVSTPGLEVRRQVMVDAVTGKVRLAFDENAEAKVRYVCDRMNRLDGAEECTRPPYTRVERQAPVSAADVNQAYDNTGLTYDYFLAHFGRDSVDGGGMPLRSTVRICSPELDTCPFQNAYWNGQQMVFGAGYAAADDVVAHELTHGITERTAQLFYVEQSGAINESMSDVFGEFVDQSNRRGNDSAGVKWLIGEDLPIGAIRDMRTPTRYDNPDRVGSPYWYSGAGDRGGVHINSGVGNKAAQLLVDGGTFNGVTVPGIGIVRAGHIYYEALTRLMTSATDYRDLYDVLPQACWNIVGRWQISAPICQAVRAAVTATEMDRTPPTKRAEAPVCPTGQFRADLFADDLENPASGRWVRSTAAGFGWAYPQTANDYQWNLAYATSGRTSMWGDDPEGASDGSIRMVSSVTLPASGTAYLRFNHAWQFWADSLGRSDGGQLVHSTDGGATWAPLPEVTAVNGPTSASVAALGGSGWAGSSRGWVSSRFDLSSLAGQSVRFGFRVASRAASPGDLGWFVDDVNIYTCTSALPAAPASVSVDDVSVGEAAGTATFTLTRTATAGSASVLVQTAPGSAVAGADFTAVSRTATFADGVATAQVQVPLVNDPLTELPEAFTLRLSSPVGVTIADGEGSATILSDDPGAVPTLSVSDAWTGEPNSGTRGMAFRITRSGLATQAVTVTVATAPGTASSTDFVAPAPRSYTLPSGVTSVQVWVQVRGDTLAENNETFSLVLSNPVGATLSDGTGVGMIIDDEGPMVIPVPSSYSVDDVALVEPAAGGTTKAVFTVVRLGDVSKAGSVVVASADETAYSTSDYVPLAATRLSFPAGTRARTVGITVNGDAVPEAHDRLRLTLSSPVGGVLSDGIGRAVLIDTDPGGPSRLSIDDAVVVEPVLGGTNLSFRVRRTGTTAEAVSATWTASSGPSPSALVSSDYGAPTGTVVVPAGATEAAVLVQVRAWNRFEPVERFTVTLSGGIRTVFGDPVAIGTIIDNN